MEETGLGPPDGGRGCCLTVAMSLTGGRVQAAGMDNDKVLTPCAFFEESYYSQHWISEKFNAHDRCEDDALCVCTHQGPYHTTSQAPFFLAKEM